jgi:glycerol-3-phosphate acyltransferase PlsY
MNILYSILIGYACGSIPTAHMVAKFIYKTNIFETGSKSMGATNVYRTLGLLPFAITLCVDVLKGMAAVLIVAHLFNEPTLVFLSSFFALLGHSFSFWVKFKGGKGVATGLGVFMALAINAALSSLIIFIVALFISRMVSLSSILGAVSLPFFIYHYKELGVYNNYLTIFTIIIALFVVYKHKANVKRIFTGTETKLSFRSAAKEI